MYAKIAKLMSVNAYFSLDEPGLKEKPSGLVVKSPKALYNNIYVPDMKNKNSWANIELLPLTDFNLGGYKFRKDKSRFNRARRLKIQGIEPDMLRIVSRGVDITVTVDQLNKVWNKSEWRIL